MKEKPTKEQVLAACPKRLVDGELKQAGEGQWRIAVPMRPRTWARRVLRLPETVTRTFELDARGKSVWEACDGSTSIEQIIRKLAEQHDLKREELEPATLKFLDMLQQRGMIAVVQDRAE